MPQELLPRLEIEPNGEATHSILWLHGLGDSGYGHEDVVAALSLPEHVRPRFILPHAPTRPVTLNGGMVMPAWYDIASLASVSRADLTGMAESQERLHALMEHERSRGIPFERQILAGFSQGGVLALTLGLRVCPEILGVLALSTYLVGEEGTWPDAPIPGGGPKIFVGHGNEDPMIPLSAATRTRRVLTGKGYGVTFAEYSMGHSICMEEIEDISRWMTRLLA